jgi:hypothetical protein
MKSNTIDFVNSIEKFNNITKPKRKLTEAEENPSIKLFMNTWGNYNTNGADTDSIKGGWMTPDKALVWWEEMNKAGEEPFINDVDDEIGLPFEIGENDYLPDVVDKINFYINLDDYDMEVFSAIMEAMGTDDFDEAKDTFESDDFQYFSGVTNDKELGEAYVDVYGMDGIPNLEIYFDYEELGRDLSIEYYQEDEDMPETAAEYYTGDENSTDHEIGEAYVEMNGISNIENYFDYKALGRDLSLNGQYTDKGFIFIY